MNSLKRKLDYHYKNFNYFQIYPDPLIFPHKYSNESDIEISAFISSIFAYGNMTQILNSLNLIHSVLGENPTESIKNFDKKIKITALKKIRHRFYTSVDVERLLLIIQFILNKYESLKHLFLLYYFEQDQNLRNSLTFFSDNLRSIANNFGEITNGIRFMFPNPASGSACKRMNLFLRWMVRKDELDFGFWNEIRKDQLLIPVDTHVARISRELKLTTKKNVSWQMAEEITENLKKFDPVDPVKYDFAICHLGIRKLKF